MADLFQPHYTRYGGWMIFRPPYQQKNARLFGFVLDGQTENLQGLCNKLFNDPSDKKCNFRPLTSDILLTFVDMEVRSLYPEDREMGWMKEKDCIFWVTAVEVKEELGIPVAQYLAICPAYIYVSNPYAMVTGRDVLGYRKNFGQITLPQDFHAQEQHFQADIVGFPEFSPDTEATWHTAVTVDLKEPPPAGKEPTIWTEAEKAFEAIVKRLISEDNIIIPGLHFIVNTLEEFLKREVFQLFMRQYPNTEATKAVYQAVQIAKTPITVVRGAGLLDGTYEVNVTELASEPIQTDLGIQVGRTLTSKFSFWVDFDFDVEAPTILHEWPTY